MNEDIIIVSIIAASASIITGLIGGLVAVMQSKIVRKEVQHVYTQINSRLDQMLKDAHELGRREGQDQERADQIQKEVEAGTLEESHESGRIEGRDQERKDQEKDDS